MERSVHKIWGGHEIPFSEKRDAAIRARQLENSKQDDCSRWTDIAEPDLWFFPVSGIGRNPEFSTLYHPGTDGSAERHPAVLVAPGGGYSALAWSHEGLDIAALLNLNGFSAFVLRYRCPDRRRAAHADAARAMRFIRFHAAEFHIDPERVGGMGFSAGGHLIATLTAPADAIPYRAQDEIDKLPYRPDFAALIYPAYLADPDLTLKEEFKVDSGVPPTFLVQAEDDAVGVENSLAWYWALKRAGVPAEMHLYGQGGHGYGLRRTGSPVSGWGELAGEWLRRQAGLF